MREISNHVDSRSIRRADTFSLWIGSVLGNDVARLSRRSDGGLILMEHTTSIGWAARSHARSEHACDRISQWILVLMPIVFVAFCVLLISLWYIDILTGWLIAAFALLIEAMLIGIGFCLRDGADIAPAAARARGEDGVVPRESARRRRCAVSGGIRRREDGSLHVWIGAGRWVSGKLLQHELPVDAWSNGNRAIARAGGASVGMRRAMT